MDEMLMTTDGKLQIVEINKQFPPNVSQLEKALVASGNLKGMTLPVSHQYRYREWDTTRNDRKQGLHSYRHADKGWDTLCC